MTASHSSNSLAGHEATHHEEKDACCHDNRQGDQHCADHKQSADRPSPCDGKDGCCGTHAVKFNLLEKQTANPILFHPIVLAAIVHHFIVPTDISMTSGRSEGRIEEKWLHKHSPPDLQSLYQRFLI